MAAFDFKGPTVCTWETPVSTWKTKTHPYTNAKKCGVYTNPVCHRTRIWTGNEELSSCLRQNTLTNMVHTRNSTAQSVQWWRRGWNNTPLWGLIHSPTVPQLTAVHGSRDKAVFLHKLFWHHTFQKALSKTHLTLSPFILFLCFFLVLLSCNIFHNPSLRSLFCPHLHGRLNSRLAELKQFEVKSDGFGGTLLGIDLVTLLF